jgi:hypothetical protein
MTERIEKDFGYLILQDGKIYDYEGAHTGQGFVYKDSEAMMTGKGVAYISEYALEELHENLADLEARYANSDMTDEEYWKDRERILAVPGETRQSIIDQIREAYEDDYMLTDRQVEFLAESIFWEADWAYISTYITDDFWIEDAIEADAAETIFTYHQYEAILNGQTPKEFGDRQLSYGELAVLDDEFDTAFKVDEDCLDDWSETGLGANARITYIEDRRSGRISGPEEFDCPEQFRK